MKICVLQSSYDGSGCALQDVDDIPSQPGAFTTQHTFEYRFIHKSNARQEIDAAAAEGFDFYFNFMWGTLDDPVAGVLESRYFESLKLPSCGVRSWERSMTKNDFYESARRHGVPIPGVVDFPLFVKPANGCASQMIDDNSVCHDEAELQGALGRINKALRPARLRRAEAMGVKDPVAFADSYDPTVRSSDDIVVQEYVDGQDLTCTVLEMGDACVALTPFVYVFKDVPIKERFMTFDIKFDDETRIQLLDKKTHGVLFERLQQVAIEAFRASGCKGSNMGCDVDLRARPDGDVFAIEVNPQPAAFMPQGAFQDLPIIHSLPGGHAAVINIFIANHLLRSPGQLSVSSKIAAVYDSMAPRYEGILQDNASFTARIRSVAHTLDFSGTTFDLACGTGIFGRCLSEVSTMAKGSMDSRVIGFDISPEMLTICRGTGVYDDTHLDRIETTLLNCHRYAPSVDHIVCFGAIHFLGPEMFAFVLVLCFTLANKSITISVDDIPDAYNEKLDSMSFAFMHSVNHMASMEAFGEPPGWKLTRGERLHSWTSPATGHDVCSTVFRFDRLPGDCRNLMFRKYENCN